MKLYREGRPVHGHLSKAHPSVLVCSDGRALKPGEIQVHEVIDLTPEELRWIMEEKPVLARG